MSTDQRRGRLDFLLLVAGGAGVQVLTIASGPLVARMLGPEGRGQMVLVFVTMSLCTLLTVGGFPAAIARAVASRRGGARDVLRGLGRLWLLLAVLPALAATLVTIVIAGGQPRVLELAGAAFLITALLVCVLVVGAALQGEGDARRVATFRLFGTAVYVLIVVVCFVVHPTDDVGMVLLFYAAAQLIGLLLGLWMLRPAEQDPDRATASDLWSFARRGYASGAGFLDSLGIDQLLVGIVLGNAALGLYATATSVSSVPVVMLMSLANMLLPRMVAAGPRESVLVLRRWIAGIVAIDLVILVGLQVVIGPVISLAFGEEFEPAIAAARICIVASALFALRRVLAAAVQAQGRVSLASRIELASTLLLVVGGYVGMRTHGIEGAAWALVGAGLLSCASLVAVTRWTLPPTEEAAERDDADRGAVERDAEPEVVQPTDDGATRTSWMSNG